MASVFTTIARIARPALLVAAVALVAACGSDNNSPTGPGDVSGGYTLVSVGGSSLPYSFTNSSENIVINSATATLLSDKSYTVSATGSANGGDQETIIADQGTYSVSGSTISFHSTTYGITYTAAATSTGFGAVIPGAIVSSSTSSFTLEFSRAM
jgi:hypothetical protein